VTRGGTSRPPFPGNPINEKPREKGGTLKTPKSDRQSVASARGAGSDPAEQSVGSRISPEVLQHVKQAREILATLKNDGIDPALFTTPLPSNVTIAEEIKGSRHKLTPVTLEPPLEEVFATAFKQVRESFTGHIPVTLPPKPLPPESGIAIELPPSDIQDKASLAHDRESRLRPLLDRKGWSTSDWAVQSGVDFHTVSKYLKGERRPYANTRAKIAKSLGIDVTELPR